MDAVVHGRRRRARGLFASFPASSSTPSATFLRWTSSRPAKCASSGAASSLVRCASRIRAAGYPCPALHPARRAHALTACQCSRVFGRTRCVLGRHLDDTWTSSPSSSACRGRRRGPASENEVAPTRLKVRNARSLPGPRSPPQLCVLHPREP